MIKSVSIQKLIVLKATIPAHLTMEMEAVEKVETKVVVKHRIRQHKKPHQ